MGRKAAGGWQGAATTGWRQVRFVALVLIMGVFEPVQCHFMFPTLGFLEQGRNVQESGRLSLEMSGPAVG